MKLLLLSPAIGREWRDAMPRNIKIELRIVAVFLSGIILGCSSNRFSVFFIPVRRFHCDVCDFRMSEKPHKLMLCDTIVNEIVGHCHCVSRWTGTEATNNHPLIIYWSLWLVRKIHYCCSAAHSLRLHRFRLRYGTGNRSLIDLNSIRQLASAIMWIGEAFAMFVDIKMVESESFCSEEKDDWGAQQTDCSFLRKDAAPNFSNIEYYSMRKFVYIISNIWPLEMSKTRRTIVLIAGYISIEFRTQKTVELKVRDNVVYVCTTLDSSGGVIAIHLITCPTLGCS